MYKHKCKRVRPEAWLLAGLLALMSAGLAAETPAPPIGVDADSGNLDVRTGAYQLSGNVTITRGALVVKADEARSFSDDAGNVERIELYGQPTTWRDVLEDGSDVDGESDELIYDFTRNLITMIGNARIRNVQGAFSGSKLVYDLDSQNLVGDGGVRLIIEPATAERARPGSQPQPEPED
jgi:lipopolysaccharide export system protein LptA